MQQSPRNIRVFLSSTFADMQTERDYLVKTVFPAFRQIAKKRYVDFSVVDLRWGVTEEESRAGKVVEICLNQIQNTHPFFIGLLGDRYGWCPKADEVHLPQYVLNKYPQVAELLQQGRSITEIEMRCGVLDNPDSVWADFFIRDGGTVRDPRLKELQHRIEAAAGDKCGVWHFSTLKQLGQYVYDALISLLDRLFPEDRSEPNQVILDNQQAIIRRYRTGYVPTRSLEHLEAVVNSMAAKHWCVLITGASGTGKTSLASNCLMNGRVFRTILNDEINTWEKAVKHFGLQHAEYSSQTYGSAWLNDALTYLNPDNRSLDWLKEAVRKEDFVWIIDGLEYLQTDEDRSLEWLQSDFLANVNLILTTADEIMARSVQAMAIQSNRSFSEIRLQPIGDAERRQIVTDFLRQYAKELSEAQMQKVVQCPLFDNVYLLELFLWEIVQFGSYEQLDAFMDTYLQTTTGQQLLYRIFDRLEKDYGAEAVRRLYGLLATTRIGLSEEDICRITGLSVFDLTTLSEAACLMFHRIDNRISLYSYIKPTVAGRYMDNSLQVERWRRGICAIREQEYRQELDTAFRQISPWQRWRSRLRFHLGYALPPVAELRQFCRIDADLIWQYLCLNDYTGLARKRSLYLLLFSVSAEREVLMEIKRVYYEHPDRLMLFLRPNILWMMGVKLWPDEFQTFCLDRLKGTPENLFILRQHIMRSCIPIWLKYRLVHYIKSILKNHTTNALPGNIETTWAETELSAINRGDIVKFTAQELPYILGSRIYRVTEEADKLIQRLQACPQQNVELLALMYVVRSFCCCSAGNYESANALFSSAVAISPTANYLVLLRYIIASGLGDEMECKSLIAFQSQPQKGEDSEPILRENRLFLLYQLLVLDHLKHFRQQEMIDVIQRVLSLYPDNASHACVARSSVAALLAQRNSLPLAAYMFRQAMEKAPHLSAYAQMAVQAASCEWRSGEKAQARKLIIETMHKIDVPEGREFMIGLQYLLNEFDRLSNP